MEKTHKKLARLKGFIKCQDGAVTVDWVVLTAGVVFMGIAAAFVVASNVPGLADKISDHLAETEVTP